MKAFRNLGGNVVEIEVDVDPTGLPILPPDTTVEPRPEPLEGHYVTVVDKSWVQIPVTPNVLSFELKKQDALRRVSQYNDWYINEPVTHSGFLFDADELARNRLTQALVLQSAANILTPAWITYDNKTFPITTAADLMGIINAVQTHFTTRFFEMATLHQRVEAATTEAELEAIVIPSRQIGF